MEQADDRIYIRHILDAIQDIETFVEGMDFAAFDNDLKTVMAVTKELEIIGEASKRLSEKLKDKLGFLPWKKIGGMRDFLVHDYMDIDFEVVWKATIIDIPELKAVLEQYLQ